MSPRSYNLLLMTIPHKPKRSPVTQLARDVGDVLVQLTRSHEMQQSHGGKGHWISTAPGDHGHGDSEVDLREDNDNNHIIHLFT